MTDTIFNQGINFANPGTQSPYLAEPNVANFFANTTHNPHYPDRFAVGSLYNAGVPIVGLTATFLILIIYGVMLSRRYIEDRIVRYDRGNSWLLIIMGVWQIIFASFLLFNPNWPLGYIFMLQALTALFCGIYPTVTTALVSAIFNTIGLFQILGNVFFISGFVPGTFQNHLGGFPIANVHLAERMMSAQCVSYYIPLFGPGSDSELLRERCDDSKWLQVLRVWSLLLTFVLFMTAYSSYLIWGHLRYMRDRLVTDEVEVTPATTARKRAVVAGETSSSSSA